MSLSLKNLKYLLALYEHLHFAKAAKSCFVSQSTLSAAIAKLEESLAVKLVERDNKRVRFTKIGKQVVDQAKQINASVDQLLRFIQLDFLQSNVNIGIIPTIAPYLLPRFLANIKKHYPRLNVGIFEDTSSNLLKQLSEHRLDFCFFAMPYELPRHISYYHLFDDKLYLLRTKNNHQQDIKQQQLILLEQGHCLRDHILNSHFISTQKIADFSCRSLETLVAMVNMDMGVSFLPNMAIKHGIIRPYQDLIIDKTYCSYRRIGIIYNKLDPQKDNIKSLVDFLAQS